jgi:hypothetical protein
MRTTTYTNRAYAALIFIGTGCGSDDSGPPTSAQGGTRVTFSQAGTAGDSGEPTGSAGAGGTEAGQTQGGSGGATSNAGSGGSPEGGSGGTNAGAGGSNASNGGTGGTPDEPEPVEPQCEASPVVNAGAGEKTNAALCFGVGDGVGCLTRPDGLFSRCESDVYWYEVEWYVLNGTVYGNIYGNNFPETSGLVVAVVYQAEDGSFRYFDPNTEAEIMFCTVVGDVANRCVWP